MLLPPNLEELIPAGHMVRVVDGDDRALGSEAAGASIQGRRDECLSSENAFEGADLCLQSTNVLIADDREGAERECELHVVERDVTT